MGNLFRFQNVFNNLSFEDLLSSSIFKKILLLISFCLYENISCAQIISWDFGRTSGTDAASIVTSHVTASSLARGNNYGETTLITKITQESDYTDASGDFNAGAATVSASFDKLTSTYFEFTLAPDEGFSMAITAINFGSRSTGTGPIAYSIRSSLDSYNSNISYNLLSADGDWYLYQNSISSVSGISPITFRIYGFDGEGAKQNVAVWRIDDLSLEVTASPLQTYYRSRQNGNWSVSSAWESSNDNTNWNIATSPPTKDADKILIQSGHTINVNSLVSLDQTIIAGALKLETDGILNINDGVGDDISIPANGVLQITSSDNYTSSVVQLANANINIATNGKIEIGNGTSSTGNGYENFATSPANVWNDGAVYEYNSNSTFKAAGLIYFLNAGSTDIPIFRVTKVGGTVANGAGSNFLVNGLFELNTDVSFSGAGSKSFRNGIRGNSTLSQTGTGKFYLSGPNAILDGTSLNIVLSAVMDLAPNTIIPFGANVIISGANIDNNLTGNIFTINGTLDVSDQGIKNTNGKIILNGIFKTKNAGGFSGSGSSIVSGNVIVNPGSAIELYANGNQSLNARSDFKNLIFSGSGIKTPNGPFEPNGTITIRDNAVFDCTGVTNGINIGNDNTNLTMTGNSRLIVSTFGPNPKMGGIYNLSGGVIEFKTLNGTPQNIRSKNYQNIEVTGNNVLMSDGNIGLNKNGTFTVKNGGVFSINDNTIIGTGDATQAVIVESGGIFKCGTNMGFNGAAITSIPIKSSAINEDIKNIDLQTGSTVDYTRNGDQPITNVNGLIYQNLVISGTGNKTAPSGELVIQGNFAKSSNAVFIHNNGTVIFNGTTAQTYSSVSPQIIFNNLTNENTTGLSINDSLSVSKNLLLKDNSVINLNADITLLSNKNQTASIGQLGTNVNIIYNAGRFIIERYINTNTKDGGHPKSWQFLSAPAFGETIFDTWQEKGNKTISGYGTWITDKTGTDNGFDASSAAPSMKYFNESSNNFTGIPGTHIELGNEKGYMVFVRGDRNATSINSPATPTVLRTRGKIYTPDFLPTPSTVSPGKFQSVGNPYPSVIDFSKINSSNIGSYYIAWDPSLGGDYGVGGYQTITSSANYKAVPGNTAIYNSTSDYRNIQSGQAFFVFNYTALTGSASFTEECKMNNNQHLVNRETSNERAILFANLISEGQIADGNAVAFDQNFSNKIDGEDALKMNNALENFAIKSAGKILAVEARDEIKMPDTIFYHLNNLIKRNYQLAFIPLKMQPGFEAYLADQFLKIQTPVSLADTTFINFTVTNEKASSDPGRFFLVFRAMADPLAISVFSINAYSKEKNVLIEWNVENEIDIKNYELEYSTDGIHFSKIGVVSRGNFAGKYTFVHEYPNVEIGFYRIKIIKINGESEYKKVVKVIIPGVIAGIQIFPNPIQQKVVKLQFVKQPLGKYLFNLYNAVGEKMLSEELAYEGEPSVSLKTIKNLNAAGIYQLEIIKPNGERTSLKIRVQ